MQNKGSTFRGVIKMTATLQSIQEKKSEFLLVKMQGLGIKRNCRDDYEYIRAKRVIVSLTTSPVEHDRLIRIATKYIGI